MSAYHTRQQQHHSRRTGHPHFNLSRAALEHVQPHKNSDRNRHPNRKHAPRTVGQRINHHNSKSRQRNQQNQQHREHRHQSSKCTHFRAPHIPQRSSLVPNRRYHHNKILHAPRDHRSNQNPDKARRESKLCSQCRAHQRPRSRDSRKMMTEENPLRRRHIVVSVFVNMRWSHPRIIQSESLRGDECAVVTIANRINAKCSQKNGEGIHRRRLVRFLTSSAKKTSTTETFYHNSYAGASRFSSRQLTLFLYTALASVTSTSASSCRPGIYCLELGTAITTIFGSPLNLQK